MKTTGLRQNDCVNTNNAKKRVAAIGRWMPIHNGHKDFLVNLAKDSDVEKLIIMIGSCYQRGGIRYSVTATEREKMLRAIMNRENIPEEKYKIVPVPDFPTFEEWILSVLQVCSDNQVTHFCTGNQEDILDVLKSKNLDLNMELINPEVDSKFPYHATDIRNMILNAEYEKLEMLIPDEIKPILFRYTFKEILAASKNQGIDFIAGRQTVDIVLLVKNILDGKVYTLLGNRPSYKQDFPGMLAFPGGSIRMFETAINAAIRKFYDETGLKINVLDNSLEPAIVKFEDLSKPSLEQMFVNGIYGTNDQTKNGTLGGSSQCFSIFIEGNIEEYKELINPKHGLENVKFYEVEKILKKQLAYEHMDMLKKAINMLEAYPKLHNEVSTPKKVRDTLVISFVGGPGTGKSTAALGTAFKLKSKMKSVEYVDEFAKSLVYNGTLENYISNQAYIIAEQYKRIYDLIGKVDYVVSDAGLQISALHSSSEKVIEDLAWHLTGKINQFTILIERDPSLYGYDEEGRIESEEESQVFSKKLEEYLKANNAQYLKVVGSDAAIEAALRIIEERETKDK